MNIRLTRSVITLLFMASVAVSQERVTYVPEAEFTARIPAPVKRLNRTTASASLKNIFGQIRPSLTVDDYPHYFYSAFGLQPTTVRPERIREAFQDYRDAEKLGWIEIRESENGGTEFVFTPEGRKRFVENPSQETFISKHNSPVFLSQRPVFLRVTGIRFESNGKALAEFLWRWEPSALGRELGRAPSREFADRAIFTRYDDGWRMQISWELAVRFFRKE